MTDFLYLRTIWLNRSLILNATIREFQLRYRGTVLGAAWVVAQPLAIVFVYTVIFGALMGPRLGGPGGQYQYSIYLCSGILTWGLFAETLLRCQAMFTDNANLIKKISFSKILLAVMAVAISCAQFAIIFAIFLLFVVAIGAFPGWSFLALFLILPIQILLGLGLGVILGVLHVFFRDIGQMTSVGLQLWYWATPIVYPASILPDWLLPWMYLNPMFHIMRAYQGVFVAQAWPDFGGLFVVACMAMGLCVFAFWLFRRLSADIVDEL